MTVVRYTFDVCLRDGIDKDTYSMAHLIEESIRKCNGVCGCEAVLTADKLGYSCVNVNNAIEWQRANGCWLGEKKRGAK